MHPLNEYRRGTFPVGRCPQRYFQFIYVAQADGKLCGYCREDFCNTENGRMIVELYLGKQGHHILRNLVLNRAAALKKSDSVSD
jgi:hypothetical protein